jgi:hypothetical protein
MPDPGGPVSRTLAAALAALSTGLAPGGDASAQLPPQTQADDYTRYELQAPGTSAFRIIYDVSATTPQATHYFNTIRAGAEEEVHGVTDLRTGAPLEWEIVEGAYARQHGHPRANPDGRYIKISLARPVPSGGQARIRIDKTYVDPESYFTEGDEVVFARSLGIRRNAVVLPGGYELVEANYPVQVDTEADGRIRVSFMNPGPGSVDFHVTARPLPEGVVPGRHLQRAEGVAPAGGGAPTHARVGWAFPERAFQNRDITYFLLEPETHSFRLFHDYTESRPGVDRYLNVVRAGSSASDPEAWDLDTGARLEVEQLRGPEITRRGIELGSEPDPDTEVVVIWFEPVPEGGSTRIRIWETYTDPGRYLLAGDELVWDRGFGRARNTVVLPDGWYLTSSAIPGVVSETDDGRIQVRYVNPRPDNLQVYVTARRR